MDAKVLEKEQARSMSVPYTIREVSSQEYRLMYVRDALYCVPMITFKTRRNAERYMQSIKV